MRGSVEVVVDGLVGKSRWLRKAPLELRNGGRALLGGARAVLLFAGGSAAKEQWYNALARGAAAAGGQPGPNPNPDDLHPKHGPGGGVGATVASVEALYAAFCARARDVAAVPYPQVGSYAACPRCTGRTVVLVVYGTWWVGTRTPHCAVMLAPPQAGLQPDQCCSTNN